MVDILLIQPPLPFESEHIEKPLCQPLGLGYIGSFLILKGFSVKILDFSALGMKIDEAVLEIKKENPKILGISVSTPGYKNALKIAKEVKEGDQQIITVFGGPHVTFAIEETLAHKEVDFVIREEGEVTMTELTESILRGFKEVNSIEGLSYRIGDRIIHNPSRPLIKDLDAIPFPIRDSPHLYKIPASLITSRGCPYKCIFCSAGAMFGGSYRVRNPKNVILEVNHILNSMNPDFFFISDDTFTINPERTKKICQEFKNLGVKWVCAARANLVNREIIKSMAESGCFLLQFGVESGSQKILNSIKKGITINQVRKGVKWCIEFGIKPVCSFMIPHPEDTHETIEETREFMKELKNYGVYLFISFTTPFPGTFLYTHAENLGIKFLTKDTDKFNLENPVIETKHLKLEDIEKAFEEFSAISAESLPSKLWKIND
ncbi:radical SAM protein [Candidatus Bathyarchaeota archaeon]|nr:radical SAM protein [Candidatus Bathyarchaeota archaeon]